MAGGSEHVAVLMCADNAQAVCAAEGSQGGGGGPHTTAATRRGDDAARSEP